MKPEERVGLPENFDTEANVHQFITHVHQTCYCDMPEEELKLSFALYSGIAIGIIHTQLGMIREGRKYG